MFGLDVDTLRNIKGCFSQLPQIEKVLLYGSRAMGNYRTGSDIDLTLLGRNLTLSETVYPLQELLEALYLPYTFDISVFSSLDTPDFIGHILRRGKTFYQKERGLREGWEEKRLGEVCEKTKSIKWQDYTSEEFEYVDLSSVSRETLAITETTTVNYENAPSRAKKIIQEGDVIFATTRPTLRRATIINQKYHNQICSTAFSVLRPIRDVAVTGFIYYFVLSEGFVQRMESLQRGASYPAVSDKDVLQTSLYLPTSLPEQKRIVAILDQAFAAIDRAKANIEKNIGNAKELFQSKLNEIFSQKGEGWEVRTLGKVCDELFAGGDVPKDRSSKYPTEEFNVPIYSNGATNDGLYGYTDKARVTKNSITVSARGTIGYSVIRTESYLPVVRLIILIPNEELIVLPFLKYVIETMDFGNSGSSIPQLTVPMIKKYKSPTPPLAEQKRIVAVLDTLYAEKKQLELNYHKQLTNLKELKKSMLQKAFVGELN